MTSSLPIKHSEYHCWKSPSKSKAIFPGSSRRTVNKSLTLFQKNVNFSLPLFLLSSCHNTLCIKIKTSPFFFCLPIRARNCFLFGVSLKWVDGWNWRSKSCCFPRIGSCWSAPSERSTEDSKAAPLARHAFFFPSASYFYHLSTWEK